MSLRPLALLLLAAAPSEWPMSRRDERNGAFLGLSAPQTRVVRPWSFEGASGRVLGYEPGLTVWSEPALGRVGERAVLAVGSYDRHVYLLEAGSGEGLWKYTTGGPVYGAPVLGKSGEVPAVFAASSDRVVYALEAESGRRLWSVALEEFRPTLGGARLAAPALGEVAGTPVLFVAYRVWDRSLAAGLQRAGVKALTAAEGKVVWEAPLGENELTAPLFVRHQGASYLLLGSADGNLYALDAERGQRRWQHTELDAVRGPPAFYAGADGASVVTASKFGTVRRLDLATGKERWQLKTGDRITGAPALAHFEGRELVLVGSYDRTLYALDAASGAVRWRYKAKGGFYSSPAVVPSAEGPAVAAAAWDHALHLARLADGAPLSQVFTGRPLWDVAGMDESNWSSPVAAQLNGRWMLFFGSYDGSLRALPVDVRSVGEEASRSNLAFWLSFPLAVAPLCALAVWLTRRARGRGLAL